MLIRVNGKDHDLSFDARVSLLDLLRDHLSLTGANKGCNQGACGACTALLDGERILSCLTLAVQCDGSEILTVEGLASDAGLHPLQRAFIDRDGLQCGCCTPGHICSAVASASANCLSPRTRSSQPPRRPARDDPRQSSHYMACCRPCGCFGLVPPGSS